jgi:heat shock protein HtpX
MKMLRTGAILVLLSIILVIAGGAIGGRSGLQIALIMAVLMNGISYFFSDKIALATSGAQPVNREQLPRLYEVMERLAGKANIPVPKCMSFRKPPRMLSPPAAIRRTRPSR